jgi:putative DNA-invertase from lambdoid prophage Rac
VLKTLPMQNRAMREYAVRRGWTIALQVKEVGSGALQRQWREKLMEGARRREIDVVLVWRLDRWERSVTDLLATLRELEHLGVGFVSLTEALDLTTSAGRAMAALLAVFAAFEREILGERVRAGLAHARQNGKRLGRPLTAALHADQVRKLHHGGVKQIRNRTPSQHRPHLGAPYLIIEKELIWQRKESALRPTSMGSRSPCSAQNHQSGAACLFLHQ